MDLAGFARLVTQVHDAGFLIFAALRDSEKCPGLAGFERGAAKKLRAPALGLGETLDFLAVQGGGEPVGRHACQASRQRRAVGAGTGTIQREVCRHAP